VVCPAKNTAAGVPAAFSLSFVCLNRGIDFQANTPKDLACNHLTPLDFFNDFKIPFTSIHSIVP
jgi:hypothetical protein